LGEGLTAQLYKMIVEVDEPPANAAPSLHVSLTFLLALAFMRDFPRWTWLAACAVVLVWLATLFTRQHHLIDVAGGILLALLVVLACNCMASKSATSKYVRATKDDSADQKRPTR